MATEMENLIESMKQNDTTFTLHHALIILPLIFGLIKGSKIALSTRIALKQAVPQIQSPEAAHKERRRRRVGFFTTLFVILGCYALGFYANFYGDESQEWVKKVMEFVTLEKIFLVCFALSFQSSVNVMLLRATGTLTPTIGTVVGKGPRLYFTKGPNFSFRRILFLGLITTFLDIMALRQNSSLLYGLFSISVYTNASYQNLFKVISMKRLHLYGLCVEVLLVTFSAIGGVALAWAVENGKVPEEAIPPVGTPFPGVGTEYYKMLTALLAPCWFRFQILLVSTCLKYDYEQYLLKNSLEMPKFELSATQNSVILPRFLPRPKGFRPRYFATALLGTFTALALMSCFTLDDMTFSILTILLAYPMTSLFTLIQAFVRKDFVTFWNYCENYTVEEGLIKLPLDVSDTDSVKDELTA